MTLHFTRNIVLQRALELAQSHGASQQRLLALAGLSEEEAYRPGGLVPSGKLVSIIEDAAGLTGLADFGIRWGLAADYRTFGALGVVASHHKRLSDALAEVGIYLAHMATGYAFVLRRDASNVSLVFRLGVRYDKGPAQYVEGNLMMLVRLARLLSNEEWSPSLVSFTHERQGDEKQYLDAFGCPVAFGQRNTAVISRRDDIDMPIAIEHTPVHDMIERVLRGDRQNEVRPLPEQISMLLPQLLPSGTATAGHVALLLDLSPRTLQRRLAEQGLTFKDVVNRKREQIVEEQIRLGFANGENLAAALGFSQPSAASRFIRSYLGKTARELKSQARRRASRRVAR
jgi:AraC-like DNA-binding protein